MPLPYPTVKPYKTASIHVFNTLFHSKKLILHASFGTDSLVLTTVVVSLCIGFWTHTLMLLLVWFRCLKARSLAFMDSSEGLAASKVLNGFFQLKCFDWLSQRTESKESVFDAKIL